MVIMITGADGFLGKNLTEIVKNCRPDNDIVTLTRGSSGIFNGDLSDPHYVKAVMKEFRPDEIWHLAAKATIKPEEDQTKIIDNNIKSTLNLCDFAPRNCFIKFASSITVYGDSYGRPAEEGSLCKPTSIYAITKLASEEIIRVYHNANKIKGINFRMCATVGRYLTHGIIKDFIKKLRSNSEYLEVLGERPGAFKPFIHVNDVARAFLKSDYPESLTTLNVTTTNPLTVEDVATIVMNELGIHKKIRWLGSNSTWFGDNKFLYANNTLYQEIVGSPLPSSIAISQAIQDNKDIS